VLCGGADAVITREADDVDVGDGAMAQRLGETAVAHAEGVVKCRVHLDVLALALVDDLVDEIGAELGDELGAGGVLDAVNGPEGGLVRSRGAILAVGRRIRVRDGDGGRERLGSARGVAVLGGVVGGKGDVVAGVPVTGGELDGKGESEEGVYGGGNVATVGDGEGAVLERVLGLGRGV
jgi:hypothetical protein